jgi:hypothetical protein
MIEKYWLVYSGGEVLGRHEARDDAQESAQHWAAAHPGNEFDVLESMATCKVVTSKWETHVDPEGA